MWCRKALGARRLFRNIVAYLLTYLLIYSYYSGTKLVYMSLMRYRILTRW